MAKIDERIASLEAKLKQEKAKKQRIEARKQFAIAKITRRQNTRRKVLVGAVILAKVKRGEWPKEKLLAMLDNALTRPNDRALFDLPSSLPADNFPQDAGTEGKDGPNATATPA